MNQWTANIGKSTANAHQFINSENRATFLQILVRQIQAKNDEISTQKWPDDTVVLLRCAPRMSYGWRKPHYFKCGRDQVSVFFFYELLIKIYIKAMATFCFIMPHTFYDPFAPFYALTYMCLITHSGSVLLTIYIHFDKRIVHITYRITLSSSAVYFQRAKISNILNRMIYNTMTYTIYTYMMCICILGFSKIIWKKIQIPITIKKM